MLDQAAAAANSAKPPRHQRRIRLGRCGIDDVAHGDAKVAFVIDAFAIADEEDLWGFVLDEEGFGDPIGNGPVTDEIKIVEINGFRLFGPFQAAFYEGAGGTAGTVFEDELGTGR